MLLRREPADRETRFRIALCAFAALSGWLFAASTIAADSLPRHYFSGYVCRSKGDEDPFKPAGWPCKKPIKDVTVTFTNSLGQVESTRTDAVGFYSITPFEMLGTEKDTVRYEARHYAKSLVFKVLFQPGSFVPESPGVTVLLQKEQRIRVKME